MNARQAAVTLMKEFRVAIKADIALGTYLSTNAAAVASVANGKRSVTDSIQGCADQPVSDL